MSLCLNGISCGFTEENIEHAFPLHNASLPTLRSLPLWTEFTYLANYNGKKWGSFTLVDALLVMRFSHLGTRCFIQWRHEWTVSVCPCGWRYWPPRRHDSTVKTLPLCLSSEIKRFTHCSISNSGQRFKMQKNGNKGGMEMAAISHHIVVCLLHAISSFSALSGDD